MRIATIVSMALNWTPTLAVHTGVRAERVSYTRIGRWWMFDHVLAPRSRCFTWVLEG